MLRAAFHFASSFFLCMIFFVLSLHAQLFPYVGLSMEQYRDMVRPANEKAIYSKFKYYSERDQKIVFKLTYNMDSTIRSCEAMETSDLQFAKSVSAIVPKLYFPKLKVTKYDSLTRDDTYIKYFAAQYLARYIYRKDNPDENQKNDADGGCINEDEILPLIIRDLRADHVSLKGKVNYKILVGEYGEVLSNKFISTDNQGLVNYVNRFIPGLRFSTNSRYGIPTKYWYDFTFDATDSLGNNNVDKWPEPIDFNKFKKSIYHPTDTDLYPLTDRIGIVLVRVLVDSDGTIVKFTTFTSSHIAYTKAVLKSLKYLKFKPAIQNGSPVSCWITIPVKFEWLVDH